MNTAGYEWAARVRALNEIEVAKARAAHVVRVPLSAGGHAGREHEIFTRSHGGTEMSYGQSISVSQ